MTVKIVENWLVMCEVGPFIQNAFAFYKCAYVFLLVNHLISAHLWILYPGGRTFDVARANALVADKDWPSVEKHLSIFLADMLGEKPKDAILHHAGLLTSYYAETQAVWWSYNLLSIIYLAFERFRFANCRSGHHAGHRPHPCLSYHTQRYPTL